MSNEFSLQCSNYSTVTSYMPQQIENEMLTLILQVFIIFFNLKFVTSNSSYKLIQNVIIEPIVLLTPSQF